VVGSLSGGERSRLSLAKMMLFPRNVLALDEPTNHLDIPAREVLEEALVQYDGTLIVVSHDRYFLDKVCRRLLVFENGGLENHLGNYSDWRSRRSSGGVSPPPPTRPATPPPAPPVAPLPPADSRAASKDRERERRRLERRVQTLEEEVGRLEGELRALRAELSGEHGGDWKKLHELADQERATSERLARRMEEWEAAAAALAQAAGN
jgi:ATP-binding cassette subfamily F protein 3